MSGAGNCPQAGEPPPPLLGLHPSGGEAAAPATHAAAPLHEPHWHGRLESPQDHAISGSRAGAGLPRTPSYPSTDPSTLTATISPGGGWLAGFKRALRKLKRDVKALNYAVQVTMPPRVSRKAGGAHAISNLAGRDTGPGCWPAGSAAQFSPHAATSSTCCPLCLATQDPRVGFLPRLLALLTIAYLLSPLDLLPVRGLARLDCSAAPAAAASGMWDGWQDALVSLCLHEHV